MCADGAMYILQHEKQAHKLDLAFLGTCRQIYQEAHVILWSTNTLSFDDGTSFKTFIDTLNTVQRQKLKQINITMDVAIDAEAMESNHGNLSEETRDWRKAFTATRVQKLKGLRSLFICIEQQHVHNPVRVTNKTSLAQVLKQVDPLFRLQTLPLTQVTVVVSDDIATEKAVFADRWTNSRKLSLAIQIKDKIADPLGADMAKAEKEATRKELERQKAGNLRTYPLLRARLAQQAQARADRALQAIPSMHETILHGAEKLTIAKTAEGKSMWTKLLEEAKERVIEDEGLPEALQRKADVARKIAEMVAVDPTLKYSEALARAEEEVEEEEM